LDTLDLIVTADTSIAHVAGALGRPVNILLRREPDWRWLARETDSVWYPTAKLFRQRTNEDWSEPMAILVADIAARMEPLPEGMSVDALPKLPLSYGELADQFASVSLKIKKEGSLLSDQMQRHSIMSKEWKKLIENNPLLVSFNKEMEENLQTLSEAESNLGLLDTKGDFGHSFIGCVREIRRCREKRADLIRRIDALVKPQGSEQEVKSAPKATKPANKKVK
jgi:hypothetical protein